MYHDVRVDGDVAASINGDNIVFDQILHRLIRSFGTRGPVIGVGELSLQICDLLDPIGNGLGMIKVLPPGDGHLRLGALPLRAHFEQVCADASTSYNNTKNNLE